MLSNTPNLLNKFQKAKAHMDSGKLLLAFTLLQGVKKECASSGGFVNNHITKDDFQQTVRNLALLLFDKALRDTRRGERNPNVIDVMREAIDLAGGHDQHTILWESELREIEPQQGTDDARHQADNPLVLKPAPTPPSPIAKEREADLITRQRSPQPMEVLPRGNPKAVLGERVIKRRRRGASREVKDPFAYAALFQNPPPARPSKPKIEQTPKAYLPVHSTVPDDSQNNFTYEQMLKVKPNLHAFAIFLSGNADRADDLVQETFLRAIKNRDSFMKDSNIDAWLFTICRNLFRSEYRHNRRMSSFSDHRSDDHKGDPDAFMVDQRGERHLPCQESGMLIEEIMEFLSCVPADQRDAVALRMRGFTYEQMAEILDTAEGTVKSRINRGRDKLADYLREAGYDILRAKSEETETKDPIVSKSNAQKIVHLDTYPFVNLIPDVLNAWHSQDIFTTDDLAKNLEEGLPEKTTIDLKKVITAFANGGMYATDALPKWFPSLVAQRAGLTPEIAFASILIPRRMNYDVIDHWRKAFRDNAPRDQKPGNAAMNGGDAAAHEGQRDKARDKKLLRSGVSQVHEP